MKYDGPFRYTLILSGAEDKRVISKKIFKGVVSTFRKPLTKDKTPKIYILKLKEEIVYVGYASQSIGKRLRQGIKAKGLNGYYGYKWKQASELELLVFVFEQDLKGNQHADDKPHIALAEAVEAELVFKVRKETGKWPEFQNEIHFNNVRLEKAKEIAGEIYGEMSEER